MRKRRSFCLFGIRRDLNPRLLKRLQGIHGYAIMASKRVVYMAKKKKGKRSKKPVWDMPPLTRKDRLVYKIVGWPLLCLFPCELLITSLWTYLGCRPLENDPQILFLSGGPASLSFLWAGGSMNGGTTLKPSPCLRSCSKTPSRTMQTVLEPKKSKNRNKKRTCRGRCVLSFIPLFYTAAGSAARRWRQQ